METTLVLIKPDAVERNLIGEILSIYEANNLKITNLKLIQATKELAEKHYEEHKNQPYFNELITYITRSPIVALTLEGSSAISKVRTINGSTSPTEAAPDTIRAKFALSKNENSVHASDSYTNAQREINIWFK